MDYKEKVIALLNDQELPKEQKEKLENIFPELKESKDERIRKTIYGWIYTQPSEFFDINCFSKEEMIDWVEKQADKDKLIRELGEYKVKYTQKVLQEDLNKNTESQSQPKFKVGYWITDGRLTCKVLGVTGKSYELHLHNDDYCHFETDIQSVDKYYRLWAIQDAEDGDVLVGKDNRPFIFTGEFDVQDDNPTAYCGINSNDKFITGKGSHWTFKDRIKPATKEQQDLLFAKMKEAGYEWDGNKKELKKMEVVSKESEDEDETERQKSSNEEAANPELPFKVGDKVVINCREEFATAYNGKEGTIINIFDLENNHWGNIVVVLDNGMRNTFYASELIKK